MNRVTFNTGAVLLVLLALPLAVGAITNTAGQDEGRDWTPSYAPDSDISNPYGLWVSNGQDYSDYYETNVGTQYGNCSYIEPFDAASIVGGCAGTGTGSVGYDLTGQTVSNTILGVPSIEMPVSHNSIPAGDYFGTSGSGPFAWSFRPNVNQYPNGSIPEGFRWTFIQPAATYACTGSHFVEIKHNAELRWLVPTLTTDQAEIFSVFIEDIETTNSVQFEAYVSGHWVNSCFIGLQVQIDLTGYEQIALNEAAKDHGWDSIYMQLTLDEFELLNSSANTNIGQTELPWNGDQGDSDFLIVQEYSTRNEAEVNFAIRGGTLVLSVAIMAVGIASTPYWDPLQNWFRGRI